MENGAFLLLVQRHLPPGKENTMVDILSRVCGLVTSTENLQNIHKELRHPGIIRMTNIVRSRNLPYSIEDVKRTVGYAQKTNQGSTNPL